MRQIAAREMNPAKSVPIGADVLHFGDIVLREVIDVDATERCGGRVDGGLCVGLGFIEIEILLRQIVGDVVPDFRSGREFDGFVECVHGIVVLPFAR